MTPAKYNSELYLVFDSMFETPVVWINIITCTLIALIPELIWKFTKHLVWDDDEALNEVKSYEKEQKHTKEI